MLLIDEIKKEFEIIINKIGTEFREQDKKEVVELCMHNECNIAYETLCSQIYEFDIKISQETFDMIRKLGNTLGADSLNWEDLTKLVTLE